MGDELSIFPKSPNDKVRVILYFARMLDKIRLHARGELGPEYQANLGSPKGADRACCNLLRVGYDDLRERVLEGGSDEEVLAWCYEKGRRLNDGDLFVWNGFASKIGWNDWTTPVLQRRKEELGITDRTDMQTMAQLFDFEEGRNEVAVVVSLRTAGRG